MEIELEKIDKKLNETKLINRSPQPAFSFQDSPQCSKEYPDYTGAYFELNPESDASLICNNGNFQTIGRKATAVANITDGKLTNIIITDSGSGYKTEPKVYLEEDGNRGAKLRAIVDDEGEVKHIDILESGAIINSVPQVEVESPGGGKGCYLCSQ